jgi:anti-sigma factor RsiW
MTCDEANPFIEAAAVGDPLAASVEAHLADCPVCRARLAVARRIDLALQQRPVASPPATFTGAVMRRLRDERWQAERVVDFGFNVAVALGVLVVVAGVGGLAWRLGFVHVSDDLVRLLFDAGGAIARRAATDTRILLAGMLLVTTAVALWWWSEEEAL